MTRSQATAIALLVLLALSSATPLAARQPGDALELHQREAGCADAGLLREERELLTGLSRAAADLDDPDVDVAFWSDSAARRDRLEAWSRRVLAVRERGLALADARSLGTLLYGAPIWRVELGDLPADTVVCSSLRPLVIEGFRRDGDDLFLPSIAREQDLREGFPVVTVRGPEGPVAWSRSSGLLALLARGSPLARLARSGAQSPADLGDFGWGRWRELIREEVDRSGCLTGQDRVRDLLLRALDEARGREDLEHDLAALHAVLAVNVENRRSDLGLGQAVGAAPVIESLEANALRQGSGQLLGVRVELAGSRRPALVRVHAFTEKGGLALASGVLVASPDDAVGGARQWLGSMPRGGACVVARAYDLETGVAGEPAVAWSREGTVEESSLHLELAWRRVGFELEATAGVVESEVDAVGFSGDGGTSFVWAAGPDFTATLRPDPPDLEASVLAVAVDASGREISRARGILSALPARTRVHLRELSLSGSDGAGAHGFVAEVVHAAGRRLEGVEFLVDGEVVEWQASRPFLLLLSGDEARSGMVVEGRARFEDGETAEGAVVLGSAGRLAEQVDVRILELPFQLRRRDRSRAELSAADLIVSLGSQAGSGGAERSPDALLLEESLPLRTQLLIDVSGTMLEERESLGLALDRFARSLKPDDEIGLVEFRETARVVLPMSADERRLVAAFETLSAGGGTALLDAIATAVAAMPAAVGRRAVVLLSDGIDEHSALGVTEVDGLLRRARVALYVIHVESTPLVDPLARDPIRAKARIRDLSSIRGFLQTRARGSGGHYCFATDQAAIEDCLAEIVEDLRRTHLAVIRLRPGEEGSGATLKLRPGIPGRLMIR